MNKPSNVQRHDRTKAKRGKMTARERRSNERKRVMALAEQAGHPHMTRLAQHAAEMDARLAELCQPVIEALVVYKPPQQAELVQPDYIALSKEARRQRIRDILDSGYQKAVEREAIVLGKDHYSVQ